MKRRKFIKSAFGVCIFLSTVISSGCSKNTAKVNYNKCVGCRLCESICQKDAILYKSGRIIIDKAKCDGCAKCSVACIYGAISVNS